MALPWAGPGGGNSTADPLLTYVPKLEETYFTSWEQARVMRKNVDEARAQPTPSLLIASTVLTGVHFAVDVVAAMVLFAGSVLLWRAWGRNGV